MRIVPNTDNQQPKPELTEEGERLLNIIENGVNNIAKKAHQKAQWGYLMQHEMRMILLAVCNKATTISGLMEVIDGAANYDPRPIINSLVGYIETLLDHINQEYCLTELLNIIKYKDEELEEKKRSILYNSYDYTFDEYAKLQDHMYQDNSAERIQEIRAIENYVFICMATLLNYFITTLTVSDIANVWEYKDKYPIPEDMDKILKGYRLTSKRMERYLRSMQNYYMTAFHRMTPIQDIMIEVISDSEFRILLDRYDFSVKNLRNYVERALTKMTKLLEAEKQVIMVLPPVSEVSEIPTPKKSKLKEIHPAIAGELITFLAMNLAIPATYYMQEIGTSLPVGDDHSKIVAAVQSIIESIVTTVTDANCDDMVQGFEDATKNNQFHAAIRTITEDEKLDSPFLSTVCGNIAIARIRDAITHRNKELIQVQAEKVHNPAFGEISSEAFQHMRDGLVKDLDEYIVNILMANYLGYLIGVPKHLFFGKLTEAQQIVSSRYTLPDIILELWRMEDINRLLTESSMTPYKASAICHLGNYEFFKSLIAGKVMTVTSYVDCDFRSSIMESEDLSPMIFPQMVSSAIQFWINTPKQKELDEIEQMLK